MGYVRAEEILPMELVELIQKYVDGKNIYIPRKTEKRQAWGSTTETRKILRRRNQEIYIDYLAGIKVADLAIKYYLSEKSIQRIIREMKN